MCHACHGTGYRQPRASDGVVSLVPCECPQGAIARQEQAEDAAAWKRTIRGDAPMTTPRYTVHPHEWSRYAIWDTREGKRVSITYRQDAAERTADMLNTEHTEAVYREAGHGEEIAPRPVVIDSANIKPLDDTPPPPEEWSYTGIPSLVIIDAANPDHWERYVWSYVANSAENRAEASQDRVQATMMGYELGYYPLDPSDWQMIPDGPYCAACIDPANGYENPTPNRPEDYPQAFHAEMQDHPDEDNEGNPTPRYCAGCHEPLYTPDDN